MYYAEHGITGPPGALAEFITVAAVNTIKIDSSLPNYTTDNFSVSIGPAARF